MNNYSARSSGRRFTGRWRAWWTPKNLLFTAIDLEGKILRVAQTSRRKTRPKMLRFAAKELSFAKEADADNPATVGQAIRDALKELKVTPSRLVMGLPRAAVLLRSLSFPQAEDQGELAAMVHFQFGKELPFPAEEAVIDFMPQPVFELSAPPASGNPPAAPADSEKTEVLAAAVRKETIEKYQSIARAAGLNLVALGLRPQAHARCLESCQTAERNLTVALVSLHPDEIIMDVICNDSVMFSRTAALKSPPTETEGKEPAPAPAPETTADSLVSAAEIELVRSLHSYEGMARHQPIQKVILTGDTGLETTAAETLGRRLNVPAQVLEPAAALGLRGAEPAHAAGALAVVGLALGMADPQGLPVDFLHPKLPPVQKNLRRQKQLFAISAAAACLLAGIGIRSHFLNQHLRNKQDLQRKLAAEQKHDLLYRQTRLQARTVQDWVRESPPWLDHLALLSTVLPSNTDLYLTSFSTSPRGSLQLSVQTRTAEILNQLDKTLRRTGYDVRPLAITPSSDKFGYPFKSSVELGLPAGKKFAFSTANSENLPSPPNPAESKNPPGRPNTKPPSRRSL